jgi:ABC-type amino acid transport substrate-binding protein
MKYTRHEKSIPRIIAILALLGLAAWTSLAGAREEVKVDIMISPEGSGPYNAYAVMQTRAKEHHEWLRPIAVETPGFNYNVAFMAKNSDKWKTTVFGSGTVVEWAAKTGLKPFYKAPATEVDNFRIIGVMGIAGNMWVTFDPNIKSPNDFSGKNVATGLLTQNEWGMHQRMLLDGWNLTKKLNSLNPLGPGQNIDALIDGRADVGTLFAPSTLGMGVTITPGPFKKLCFLLT